MDKNSWLRQLKSELTDRGVTKVERSAVLHYYNEMYQDKLEDGLTEKEILLEFGFPQDVADSVLNEDRKEKRLSDRKAWRVDRDIFEDDDFDEDDIQDDVVIQDEEEIEEKPKKKKETFITGGVVSMFISTILAIVFLTMAFAFYLTTVLMILGGIAVIITSFTVISRSIGEFAIIFGAGFIVFAIAGFIEILGRLCAKAFKGVLKSGVKRS